MRAFRPWGGRVSGRDECANRPPKGRENRPYAHGGLRDAPSGIACARRYRRTPEAGEKIAEGVCEGASDVNGDERRSFKHFSFVVCDLVSLEQFEKFGSKIAFAVVVLLMRDVALQSGFL
jgi:hypothetical protein